MKGVRTFIGIFPPPEIQAAIAHSQALLKPDSSGVRWEAQNKFHITLKFLGSLTPPQLDKTRFELSRAGEILAPFNTILNSIGCFPDLRSPKIIWIGSSRDGNPPLSKCFAVVDEYCAAAGFKKDERPFLPHITLGRVKGKIPEVLIKKIETITFEPLQFLCTELLIMKSDLSSSGSAYSQQYTIPLKH